MKISRMAVALVLVTAVSAQGKAKTDRQVAVYVRNGIVVPFILRAEAQSRAAQIFGRIGVGLNWRERSPAASESDVIIIEFVDHTPDRLLRHAWAYSLPFEGVHIQIFWDRLQFERCVENVLAYVMVHEITHILEATDSHSSSGIMNVRWTSQERGALETRSLQFADDDVEMIYRGVDSRARKFRPLKGSEVKPD